MENVAMDVVMIPIANIMADEDFNSRGKIAPIDVADLATDIDENGLLQPVIVAPVKDSDPVKYTLIAGFRRHMACRVLERKLIAASIRPDLADNPIKAICLNLSENTQRQNLNILQEAKAIQKLHELKLGEFEVAKLIGKSRGWVQVRFMLLGLPEEIQEVAAAGIITQSNVRELTTLLSEEGIDAVYAACKIIKEAKQRDKRKPVTVNPKSTRLNIKKHRNRPEIFKMMSHLDASIPRGLHSRSLAWAAGELTTEDYLLHVKMYADESGHEYTVPLELN